MNIDALRQHLSRVQIVLRDIGDTYFANVVGDALSGPDQALESFAVSNQLWGGAGSVADQAGMDAGSPERRKIEAALLALGEEQIAAGKVNARTRMWVDAFKHWQRKGI